MEVKRRSRDERAAADYDREAVNGLATGHHLCLLFACKGTGGCRGWEHDVGTRSASLTHERHCGRVGARRRNAQCLTRGIVSVVCVSRSDASWCVAGLRPLHAYESRPASCVESRSIRFNRGGVRTGHGTAWTLACPSWCACPEGWARAQLGKHGAWSAGFL